MTIPILPPEGSAHPLFAEMGPLEAIEVYFCYLPGGRAGPPETAVLEPVHAEIRRACDAAAGEEVGLSAWWNSSATRFIFPPAPHPDAIVAAIVAAAPSYPAPVNQILIRRGEADERAMIVAPARDPRAPDAPGSAPRSNKELWDAAFGDEEPTIGAVSEDIGLIVTHDSAGGVVTETRLSDPYHPRIRILGYLGAVEQEPARTDEPRARALAAAFRDAVDGRWPAGVSRPRLISRASPDDFARLDPIRWRGRAGFGFAIERDGAATIQPLVDGLRCREDELIAAAIDVIEAHGLHPTLNWERYNGVYVMNLWE